VACSVHHDANGTSYLIAAAETVKTPGAHQLPWCPTVDIWWSRSFGAGSAINRCDHAEETLIIRQEYADRPTADVLELTLGQAYALIEALNKAVENT
jgi:hypothetical protein